jgi:acyl carrier protein
MPDRVRSIVADVLQLPEESVTDDLGFNETRQWDSVNHINMMLALEEAFGISIADDQVVELTTVGAIRRYLAETGVLAGEGSGPGGGGA